MWATLLTVAPSVAASAHPAATAASAAMAVKCRLSPRMTPLLLTQLELFQLRYARPSSVATPPHRVSVRRLVEVRDFGRDYRTSARIVTVPVAPGAKGARVKPTVQIVVQPPPGVDSVPATEKPASTAETN